ncbi:MAG TPA: hypothetical protein VLA24_00325 [Pseudomonadales bacterium]|nr:hypothetical protein [Pseudomonadales bacterium]
MRWGLRLLGLMAALGMAKWAIDDSYQKTLQGVVWDKGCDKVWAHRGRLANDPPNTLASAERLLLRGAKGLELDIHYDPVEQRFWVIHDDPTAQDKQQRDTLDAFLSLLGPQGLGLWLDAKNFGSLAPWHAVKAADRLQQLLALYAPQSRVFVESRNPLYLLLLKQRGVGTSYLISPNAKHASAVFWLNVYWMKWSYTWGPFDALSMDIGRYNDRVKTVFGEVPLLLSTINQQDVMAPLIAQRHVIAILTDANLLQLGQCP